MRLQICSFVDFPTITRYVLELAGTSVRVLFEGRGDSATEQNNWPGWYSKGQLGAKKSAYDTLPLLGVRFEDDSGRYVEYRFDTGFSGRTLLSTVQSCKPTSLVNDGSAKWNSGFCPVASVVSSSGDIAGLAALRIAVGDGQTSDPDDWALFMPLSGNGGGDYKGGNVWAFGGEHQANNGYAGIVRILGVVAGVLMHGICHLLQLFVCTTCSMCRLNYSTWSRSGVPCCAAPCHMRPGGEGQGAYCALAGCLDCVGWSQWWHQIDPAQY